MKYTLEENTTILNLEIGKSYTGNIVSTNTGKYLFSPRTDGIYVFKTTGKIVFFIEKIQVNSDEYYEGINHTSYLKILKEKIIPDFFKKRIGEI